MSEKTETGERERERERERGDPVEARPRETGEYLSISTTIKHPNARGPYQVVHFGGYLLGKAHSQRVRVVNISRTSQRLHILGPSTDCFKVRMTARNNIARKGVLNQYGIQNQREGSNFKRQG